jgi:hypothetical protein
MILNSLITQIFMAVLAVGIFFTYVKPTFTNIGVIQTAIEQYKLEFTKVDEVNTKLKSLYAKANDMSLANKNSLARYMPDAVDDVMVSRDILYMADKAGAYLVSVEASEAIKNTNNKTGLDTDGSEPVPHAFLVDVSGTYSQIKNFLRLLEQNNYPLEVSELNMRADEKSLMTASIIIITYSRI